MNQALLQKLRERLNVLIREEVLDHAEIALFGMNTPGDRIIQFLEGKGYHVSMILDNNPLNHGKKLLGVPVCSPEVLKEPFVENFAILICSKYYIEMCGQLEMMGYRKNKHIFQLLEMNQGMQMEDTGESWEKRIKNMRKCTEILKKLIKKYEKDTHFLLCPICANGDVYITAALRKKWEEIHGISSSVLVVIGNIGRKVAGIFASDGIEVVSQENMEALTELSRFLGKSIPMTVVHPGHFYFQIFPCMEGFRKLNFMDFMAGGVLNLKKPYLFSNEIKRNHEMHFSGKEVILAPYANSIPDFSMHFWERLAMLLQEKGYLVYTNGDGEMEPPVKGTKSIFLPIDEMSSALEESAAFIAIRNGLCDLLSGAGCKKVILYPEKAVRFGWIHEYYGLKEMGLLKDGVELIYREEEEGELLGKIMDYIS